MSLRDLADELESFARFPLYPDQVSSDRVAMVLLKAAWELRALAIIGDKR